MKNVLVSKTNLDCLGFLICNAKLSSHCSPFPLPRWCPWGGGKKFLIPKGLNSRAQGCIPNAQGCPAHWWLWDVYPVLRTSSVCQRFALLSGLALWG